MDKKQAQDLLFDGSVWCNLDVALRSVDHYFRRHIHPDDLSVIEWYILRSLYEQDGQHASKLAQGVGRAATSFTPNLDKLQEKGYIERRPDPVDRRAVRIYLTRKGEDCREAILSNAAEVDATIAGQFNRDVWQAFAQVMTFLQQLDANTDPDRSVAVHNGSHR